MYVRKKTTSKTYAIIPTTISRISIATVMPFFSLHIEYLNDLLSKTQLVCTSLKNNLKNICKNYACFHKKTTRTFIELVLKERKAPID